MLSSLAGRDLQKNFFTDHHFHLVYFKDTIRVELHWDIRYTPSPALIEALLQGAKEVTVDNARLWVLNPEGSVLVACFNFVKDYGEYFLWGRPVGPAERTKIFYYGLSFFYELKKMLEFFEDSFSWEKLRFYTHLAGAEDEMATLLFLARRVADIPMPRAIIRQIFSNFFVIILRIIGCFLGGPGRIAECLQMRRRLLKVGARIMGKPRMTQ
jgi:hypothetical protein